MYVLTNELPHQSMGLLTCPGFIVLSHQNIFLLPLKLSFCDRKEKSWGGWTKHNTKRQLVPSWGVAINGILLKKYMEHLSGITHYKNRTKSKTKLREVDFPKYEK